MTPDFSPTAAVESRRLARDVVVFFGLLFGVGLGRTPLANPYERRYEEIPRKMIASGDWDRGARRRRDELFRGFWSVGRSGS